MQVAYGSLSAPIQPLLDGITAFHGRKKDLLDYGYRLKAVQTYPEANHQVVIRHCDKDEPVLHVNEPLTEHINKLGRSESAAIVDMLHRQVEAGIRFHCRVRWRRNTLFLWDYHAAKHHAVWDY